MNGLMTTTSAWTYASARSHPHRVILVITSILQAAHCFLWNCTFVGHCWYKENILVHIKRTSLLKVWMNLQYNLISVSWDKHCYAKAMNTHQMKGKWLPFICHYLFIKALSLRLTGIPKERVCVSGTPFIILKDHVRWCKCLTIKGWP